MALYKIHDMIKINTLVRRLIRKIFSLMSRGSDNCQQTQNGAKISCCRKMRGKYYATGREERCLVDIQSKNYTVSFTGFLFFFI